MSRMRIAAGERYLPDEMPDRRYYRPVSRGLEIKIGEALARLRGQAAAIRSEPSVIDANCFAPTPQGVARNLARRGFALDVAALQKLEERRKQLADRERPSARRAQRACQGGRHGKGRGEDIAPLIAKGEALTRRLAGVGQATRRNAGGARSVADGLAEPAARVGAGRAR